MPTKPPPMLGQAKTIRIPKN
jgi:hypothetical protein